MGPPCGLLLGQNASLTLNNNNNIVQLTQAGTGLKSVGKFSISNIMNHSAGLSGSTQNPRAESENRTTVQASNP